MPASEEILRSIEDHLRQIEEEMAALSAALQALEGESGAASPAPRRSGRQTRSAPRRRRAAVASPEPEAAPRRRRGGRTAAEPSGANGAAAETAQKDAGKPAGDAGEPARDAGERAGDAGEPARDAGEPAGESGHPAVVSGGDANVVELGSVATPADAGDQASPAESAADPGVDTTATEQSEASSADADADAEPAPRRTRREALSAERVAEILAESDEGLSAIAIAKRASASANRVLSLLRELQAAGRARAEGTRRTSRWKVTPGE